MKTGMREPDPRTREDSSSELPPPTGTIFILTMFLVVLAGVWGGMYLLMLSR